MIKVRLDIIGYVGATNLLCFSYILNVKNIFFIKTISIKFSSKLGTLSFATVS